MIKERIYYPGALYFNDEFMETKMSEKKWIQEAIKEKGSLRKSLNVKKGQKIPASKLEAAEHSKNPKTRKRAQLASTLKAMHKK